MSIVTIVALTSLDTQDHWPEGKGFAVGTRDGGISTIRQSDKDTVVRQGVSVQTRGDCGEWLSGLGWFRSPSLFQLTDEGPEGG